jgi:hypothetical protein
MTLANGRRRLDLRSAGLRNVSYGSWLRENSEIELSSTALGRVRARSVHPLTADIAVLLRQVRFVPKGDNVWKFELTTIKKWSDRKGKRSYLSVLRETLLMSQTTHDSSVRKRDRLLAQLYWPPLFLLALAVGFVLAFPAAIAAWFLYYKIVPAYSASTYISETQTTLTLRFYYTEDENADHGRYLYVSSPNGAIRIAMTAFDWAHNSRTSVYLTPQHSFA